MKRILYGSMFLILFLIEALIAVYVHDDIIRPYIGDMLVVLVVYCFIRTFMPDTCRLLPLYVFLFASGIEILQYFDLVKRLGLEGNRILRIMLGSVFDIKDIFCYAAGCLILTLYEILIRNYKIKERKNL